MHDLNLLHSLGIHLVVVHGCRPQVEAILAQQGFQSRYAHGVRVTDADAMDCVLEAAGQVRARIEALLSLGLAGSPMAGSRNRVSSGNYITAKPLGIVDGVDMLHTGEVRRVEFPVPLVYLEEERSFGGSLDDARRRKAYYMEVLRREMAEKSLPCTVGCD